MPLSRQRQTRPQQGDAAVIGFMEDLRAAGADCRRKLGAAVATIMGPKQVVE